MSRLLSLSTAIGILQLTSSQFRAVNAAPERFTLDFEIKNITMQEAGSRYGNSTDYTNRYGVKLLLGTPPQPLYLVPTTSESQIFVVGLTQCEPYFCEEIAGGQFASNESSTWNPMAWYNTTGGRNNVYVGGGGNTTVGTEVGEFPGASTNISLRGIGESVNVMTSPLETTRYPVNVLGLGKDSSFLRNLLKSEIIPKKAFGYFNNTLDIGGINEDRIDGERFEFPIVQDYIGGFRVSITDMEIDGKSIMTRTPGPINATIAMNRWQNFVPRFVYEDYMNMTGGEEPSQSNNILFPGWNDTNTPFTGYKFVVTLSNGLKLTAHEENIRIRMTSESSLLKGRSMTNILPMDLYGDEDMIEGVGVFLGAQFLNSTYFYVDYDRDVFELADAKLPPAAATTGNSTGNGTSPADDPSSASSSGANMYALAAMALISSAVMIGGAF